MENFQSSNRQAYFRCQFDITNKSDLYGDNIKEHGSKIVTLFAEVYAALVGLYGVETTRDAMLNFENSDKFKKWFWSVKYRLGTIILHDPQFDDIGLWLGKGLFLKIILSTICFNKLDLDQVGLEQLLKRQQRLLETFVSECDKKYLYGNRLSRSQNGYTILGENVCLNNCNDLFQINLI